MFAGLAWFGLRSLGAFGGRRLVMATISPLLQDIKDARIEAIRGHRPYRLNFTDLASAGRYCIEAYIPEPGDWWQCADMATSPHLWRQKVERVLQPQPKVILGSSTIVYIHPEGWFTDRWRVPEEISFLPTTRYSFTVADVSMTVMLNGQEIRTVEEPLR